MSVVRRRDDDASWPSSIRGAKNIVRGIVRLGGGHGFHGKGMFREHPEELGQPWLHLANVAPEIIDDLIRRFRYVFRIAIERGAKTAQVFIVCFKSKIGKQTVDPPDLSKPKSMNFGGRHIRGGLLPDRLLVSASTVRP